MLRAVVCLLFVVAVAFASSARADEWVLLDGQQAKGEIAAIDAAGKITGTNIPAGLELAGLRRIDRTVADSTNKGSIAIDLVGGGRVAGDSIAVESEKFHLTWSLGDKLVLPMEVVRAVRLRPTVTDEAFEAALAKPSTDNDRLFVEIDGKLTMLTGLVESLTAESVSFQYEGAKQTLPVEKLFGIVVAQIGKPAKVSEGVTVELADGSRIPGVSKGLADGKLNLTVGSTAVALPWVAVKSVVVRSSRLSFLSDLEPTAAEEYRLVTLPQSWQRDKSVAKKTLTLGDRKFDRGIGTHAYSRLVFAIDGQYDLFSAVIGIDAAAERKGNCVFVVLGDGRELAREKMTGASEAKELKVNVSGVKELSLVVEPGEELDLADLADWADARVIKQK